MNKNIKKVTIGKLEALDMSTNKFIDWYTRGRKNSTIDNGTKRQIKNIIRSLKKPELGELISFAFLEGTDFTPIYSNIHKKSSEAYTTSVDIITKKDDKYFFTEVKTPINNSHSRINSNMNDGANDIDGRLEDIEAAVGWTELDIDDEDLIDDLWGGIVCLVTSKDQSKEKYKDKKYLTYLIFVKDFDKMKTKTVQEELEELLYE